MLNKIELRNIKCFDKFSSSLCGLNIFTGINGAGKSTVIQSILLILQSEDYNSINLNGPLVEIGDYSDFLHETATDDGTELNLTIQGINYSWGHSNSDNILDKTISKIPLLSGNAAELSLQNSYIYISAERWGPRNNVSLNSNHTNPNWLGIHGEFTIPVLGNLSERKINSILNNGDPRIHGNEKSALILENIIAWMGEISANVNINARLIKEAVSAYSTFSFNDSKDFRSTNVGFGLSYALSVVTALLIAPKGSLVIIENPEAHIHPRGQSKLGHLLALTAKAGVQVITETHSEHVVNGSRLLVRKKIISPDQMNVIYFQRDNDQKKSGYQNLTMNIMGQFDEWPVGFFDQQANDMKELIKG